MKPNRSFWPLGIVIFFILFASAMAVVVAIAAAHRDSLVSENYYEQELHYQNRIDSAVRTKNSGATVVLDAAGTSLLVSIPPAMAVQKISGGIELYRPSAPELDRQFPLQPQTDGVQKVDVSQLASGLWVARVKWNAGGQEYFLEQKITVAGK
jgi:hypothetical protein